MHVAGRGPQAAAWMVHRRRFRGPPSSRLGNHVVISLARRCCRRRRRRRRPGCGRRFPSSSVTTAAAAAVSHDVGHTWVFAQSVRRRPLARVRVHQLQRRNNTRPVAGERAGQEKWGGQHTREQEATITITTCNTRNGSRQALRNATGNVMLRAETSRHMYAPDARRHPAPVT